MKRQPFRRKTLYKRLQIPKAEQTPLIISFEEGLDKYYMRLYGYEKFEDGQGRPSLEDRMHEPYIFGFGVVEAIRNDELSLETRLKLVHTALSLMDPGTEFGEPHGLSIFLSFLAQQHQLSDALFDTLMHIVDAEGNFFDDLSSSEEHALVDWLLRRSTLPHARKLYWLWTCPLQDSRNNRGIRFTRNLLQHPDLPDASKKHLCLAWLNQQPPKLPQHLPPPRSKTQHTFHVTLGPATHLTIDCSHDPSPAKSAQNFALSMMPLLPQVPLLAPLKPQLLRALNATQHTLTDESDESDALASITVPTPQGTLLLGASYDPNQQELSVFSTTLRDEPTHAFSPNTTPGAFSELLLSLAEAIGISDLFDTPEGLDAPSNPIHHLRPPFHVAPPALRLLAFETLLALGEDPLSLCQTHFYPQSGDWDQKINVAIARVLDQHADSIPQETIQTFVEDAIEQGNVTTRRAFYQLAIQQLDKNAYRKRARKDSARSIRTWATQLP